MQCSIRGLRDEGLEMRDMRLIENNRKLIKMIYCLKYPTEEKFGLQSQIRRAIVSVSLNVVEGNARKTTKDYLNFCSNAKGSLYEVEECLRISIELGFINSQDFKILLDELVLVRKQLLSLITYLKSQI